MPRSPQRVSTSRTLDSGVASDTPVVAALDCGSNSTRLLIVDGEGHHVAREMQITRLGQGVDATGALDRSAIDRVLATLSTYADQLVLHGVERAVMTATSAVRDASNGAAFLDEASAVLHAPCVVLSGDDEARLSYRGATADLNLVGSRPVVLDIGGGSTELITEGAGGLEAISLQLGCVRNTERFLASMPPTAEELARLRDAVAVQLETAMAALPSLSTGDPLELVGLAGTVAALVMVDRGLAHYDRALVHHARLSVDDVASWTQRLSGETTAERLAHRGMEPGRADVLVGGLVVLLAVMERIGAQSVLHSEADILDGVADALRSSSTFAGVDARVAAGGQR